LPEGEKELIAGKLQDYLPAFGKFATSGDMPPAAPFRGVAIDSRVVATDNMFFCIVGEKHDGHDFIPDAVARGARVIVVDQSRLAGLRQHEGVVMVGVDNTLTSMQELARAYLDRIKPRRIALTGTNGKTTSKNLIAAVLAARYRTCATRGNLNNQFGVPLSIFEFDPDCEVAVMEFGMSTPGEISRLVELYSPDIRVILNIGPAHLATMKTLEAIAEAKFEILQNARETDWAVLNMDDPNIRSRSYRYRLNRITYGTSREYEVHPEKIFTNGSGHAHLIYKGEEMKLPILGLHHVSNVLAAIAVARVLDVPYPAVKAQIESYVPDNNRMGIENVQGVTIVNDAYNANPVSVAGALETITTMKVTGKRVVVLGDMLELGDKAPEYHQQLGRKLALCHPDRTIVAGEFADVVRKAAVEAGLEPQAIDVIQEIDEIVDVLNKLLLPGDLLLLKASRALQFEKIDNGLKATLGRRN
jgi:UDP-N-acetylmuramoyl-tripeptide--D-alanyl-D-alanine ligase